MRTIRITQSMIDDWQFRRGSNDRKLALIRLLIVDFKDDGEVSHIIASPYGSASGANNDRALYHLLVAAQAGQVGELAYPPISDAEIEAQRLSYSLRRSRACPLDCVKHDHAPASESPRAKMRRQSLES